MDYRKGLILKNCSIVDVINERILYNRTITINGNRIISIEKNRNIDYQNFDVINVNHRYVIPGLIDGHCHGTLPSINGFNPLLLSSIIDQTKRNYIQQLMAGVTTIRDTGAMPK